MPPARIGFWVLTLAAFAFCARAALRGPPPLWVAAIAIGLYLGAVMAGVLFLNLRVFVDAVLTGPEDARGVALTFDDGPDPKTTPRVLDALDKANVKATFFVIGQKAEKHPEVIKDILARGHTLGLHSYAHDRLFAMRGPGRWRADLTRGIEALEKITGERPRWFRPPIGHTNPHVSGVLAELELVVVGWSVSARDGTAGKSSQVTARVLKGVRDGANVLMHDASERESHDPPGVAALPKILRGLERKRLAVTPLKEWIEDESENVHPARDRDRARSRRRSPR